MPKIADLESTWLLSGMTEQPYNTDRYKDAELEVEL